MTAATPLTRRIAARQRSASLYAGMVLLLLTGAVVVLAAQPTPFFDINAVAPSDTRLQLVFLGTYAVMACALAPRLPVALEIAARDPALVALLVFVLASSAWSADPALSIRRGVAVVLTATFGLHLATRFSFAQVLRLLVLVLGATMVLSVLTIWLLPEWGTSALGWRGVFLFKNNLGRFAGLTAVAALVLAGADGVVKRQRVVLQLLAFVSVVLLVGSQARSALVVFVMCLVGLWLFPNRRRRPGVTPSIAVAFVAVLLVAYLVGLRPAVVLSLLGKDSSLTGRTPLWHYVVQSIEMHPWVGFGFSGFWGGADAPSAAVWAHISWLPRHAHNGILDLWLDLGAVGVLLLLVSLGTTVVAAVRAYQAGETSIARFGIVVVVFLLASSSTESIFLKSNVIFTTLAAYTSFAVRDAMHKRRSASSTTRLGVLPPTTVQGVPVQFYRMALRRHWRLIVLLTGGGMVTAFVFAGLSRPAYQAEAQLFVGTTSNSADSAGLNQSGQFAQQRVKSYVELVSSPRVLEPVISRLGLPLTVNEFAGRVEASAPLDTVLINVRVTDADPQLAAEAANLIADQFAELAPQLETERSGEASPVAVTLARPATVPTSPIGESRPELLVLGALAGLALGLAGAFTRLAWRVGYTDEDQIRDGVGLEVLQEVDACLLRDEDSPQGYAAAATYRFLMTRLQAAAPDRAGRAILVVTADQTLDTTSITAGLVRLADAAHSRVVAVDADVAAGRLSQVLAIEASGNLAQVFGNTAGFRRESTASVEVVGAGAQEDDRLFLPSAGTLRSRLQSLSGPEDRLTFVNGPAVLENADALMWAQVVEQTVLVIGEGTPRRDVERAVRLLRSTSTSLMGVVVVRGRRPGVLSRATRRRAVSPEHRNLVGQP
ncbi:O-antigen ligase family protein [Kineococcus sp. GCM10028916]|uniref:O-antigen ligase family protein n=1 Tax=Kineococcus sp. GCM10028916 TaxID=3273394 RepID=UPI003645C5BD